MFLLLYFVFLCVLSFSSMNFSEIFWIFLVFYFKCWLCHSSSSLGHDYQSKQRIPVFHLPSLSSTSSGGKTFPSQPRNVIFPACRGSFHTGPQTAPVQVGGHCLIKPAELHHLRKSSARSSGHIVLRNSGKISFAPFTAEGLSVGLRRSLMYSSHHQTMSWVEVSSVASLL